MPRPAPTNAPAPSDAQVIGAVQRALGGPETILLCAAGGLPGELHKLWQAERPGGYHMEYGFSTMGYEIAGGLGAKLARPDKDVVVMVGDGSYLMLNSELYSAVMLGVKLTVVLLDNGGYGCINRLQMACGGRTSTISCPTRPMSSCRRSTSPRTPPRWASRPRRSPPSPSWRRR